MDNNEIQLDGAPFEKAMQPVLNSLKEFRALVIALDQSPTGRLSAEMQALKTGVVGFAGELERSLNKLPSMMAKQVKEASQSVNRQMRQSGKESADSFVDGSIQTVRARKRELQTQYEALYAMGRIKLPVLQQAQAAKLSLYDDDAARLKEASGSASANVLATQRRFNAAIEAEGKQYDGLLKARKKLQAEEVSDLERLASQKNSANDRLLANLEKYERGQVSALTQYDGLLKARKKLQAEEVSDLNKLASGVEAANGKLLANLGKRETLRAKSASSIDPRVLLDLPSERETKSARGSASVFRDAFAAADIETAQKAAGAKAQLADKTKGAALESARLREEQKALANSLGTTHSAARGLASGFNAMFLTWGQIGPLLAGAAISHGFVTALKAGAEFEQNLAAIQYLGGETELAVRGIGAAALDLARSGPVGPVEIAKAFKTLALAGLNAKEQLEAIKPVMNFSIAGELEINKAAESLTAISTAFGYNAKGFGAVSDVISKAAAISMSSVGDMTEAFRQASTVAQQFGVSIDDAATTLIFLSQVGIKGSAAGTAMRNMYNELMGSSKSARKVLRETLDIDVVDNFTKSVKPLNSILADLAGALAKLDFKSQQAVLAKLGNERGLKALSADLIAFNQAAKEGGKDAVTELQRIQQALEDAPGFAAQAAVGMGLTAQNQMKAVGSSLQAALVEAFQKMQPEVLAVSRMLQEAFASPEFRGGLSNLINGVAAGTQFLMEHADALKAVALGYGIGKVALIAMSAGTAVAAATSGALSVALTASGVAAERAAAGVALFRAALGPISIALTLAAAAYVYFSDRAESETQRATKAVANHVDATIEGLKKEEDRLRAQMEARAEGVAAQLANHAVEARLASSRLELLHAEERAANQAGHAQLLLARNRVAGTEYAGTAQGANALSQMDAGLDASRGRIADTVLRQVAKENELSEASRRVINLAKQDAREATADAAKSRALRTGKGVFDPDSKKTSDGAAANAKSAYDVLKQKFHNDLALLEDRAKLEDGVAKLREATTKSTYNLGITDFKAYQDEMDRLQSGHSESRLRTAVEAQALANKFLQESTQRAAAANALQDAGKKVPVSEEKLLADQADALRKAKLETDKVQQLRNQQATEELARMEQAAAQMVKASRAALDKLDNSKLELGFLREQTAERSAQMLLFGREAEVEAARLQSRDSFRKAERDLVREIAQYELQIASSKSLSGTGQYVSPADALRDPARRQQLALAAARDNLGKLRQQGPIDGNARATEAGSLYDAKALAKLLDPQKAQDYGNALKGVLGEANNDVVNLAMSMDTLGESMKGAFGSAGAALGQLMGVMQSYGAKQEQIDAARRGALQMEIGTVAQAAAQENALSRISSQEMNVKIGAYADMASAAKGFFREGSTGYKTMDGIAKTAHMAQVAMNLVEMGQLAVKAVLNQAGGDSYSAFFRMAAMAAAVGALGFAVGGGFNSSGGGESAADLQKRQGTGTVLGDEGAKSNSLVHAMQALQDNTLTQLKYSSKMLSALQGIERAMGGVASIIFRVGGITSGNPLGIKEGAVGQSFGQQIGSGTFGVGGELRAADKILSKVPVLGALISAWGKVTNSITDSGVSISGNLGNLSRGRGMSQYTDVATTTSSFFGLVKRTTNSTQTSELNEAVSKQFGLVFKGISDSIQLAGVSFGMDSEALYKKLAESIVDIPKISLRGLKGQELQDALQAVFSGAADGLAASVMPGLEELQKTGEGYYETLIRASSALSTTNTWLKMFKMNLLETSMAGAIAATKLSELFGGVNELNAANQAFYEAYFTEAERAAQSTEDMRAALATVNLALPESKEALRAMVAGLDLSTEAGREAYKVLLSIAPEFSSLSTALDKLSKESAAKLIKTFTADGTLVPALDVARLNTLRLGDSLTSTYTVAGAISTLFLNASSGLITFGSTTAALTNGLTGAQVAGQALNDSIDTLRNRAGQARIDMEGLAKALAGVDTKTFMHTIETVLESLAGRVKATLDAIGNERVAVREAALRIVDPGVMTRDAVLRGISGISVSATSNGALTAAQASLLQADTLTAQKRQLMDQAKAQTPSRSALTAAEAALAAFTGPDRAAFTGAATPGSYQMISNGEQDYSTWVNGTPGGFDQGGYDAEYARQRAPLVNNLANQLTQYAGSTMINAAAIAGAQAELTAATQRQAAAVLAARAAQLAYIASLQDFSIDSSKAVGKLGRLREETMKYYEAQKQLADLMKTSAQGLRATVADYRFNQLTDAQKFDKLQAEFSKNYAMGLSTEGSTLAGYGDKLNAGLNPLLEAAQANLSDDAYKAFAATALARAEAIAARLEILTPTNYAADSLEMLGAIDSALAAIEASSKSAEKIIAEAIAAGSDKTAAGLRAVIAALTGQPIPGFASGGDFPGGLRIVGENGPELESTGPSRIFNAGQTRDLLGAAGNNNDALVFEVRALRAEVTNLNAAARATAANTNKLTRQGDRVERDGVISIVESDFTAAYAAA